MTEIQRRKQRWLDFYDRKTAGPLYTIRYNEGLPARPFPRPDNKAQRIEWAWLSYQRQLDNLTWLACDAIPFIEPYTGTEIFAEAFGCSVHYPDNDMPFARPLIHSAADVASVKTPDWSRTSLAMLFEIADELRKRDGGDALLRLPDIQSPMDIAALILEKSAFYEALVECPEAVLELAGKVHEVLTSFLDAWFARYGREFMAHYPDYYMPLGITLSEDEVGAVNGAMFDELFLPELTRLSNRYGAIGIHCCATARHQWEGFKKVPNLKLVNFVHNPQMVRDAWWSFADHCAQLHSWAGDGPPWTWHEQHPKNARLVLDIHAETREQAEEIAGKMASV